MPAAPFVFSSRVFLTVAEALVPLGLTVEEKGDLNLPALRIA